MISSTYGGIGLLPQKQWLKSFHPLIKDYIYFIKLGHLNGSINWTTFTKQLHVYTTHLGEQLPSAQLLHALFNYLRKPRRWNGGYGRDIAGVRVQQRATTLVEGVKFLHNTWKMVVVQVDVPLFDVNHHRISDTAFLVVPFDMATGGPMGCWTCEKSPGEREACLALYVALWHPGAHRNNDPGWPIHGIPKTLLVQDSLTGNGITNLQHQQFPAGHFWCRRNF